MAAGGRRAPGAGILTTPLTEQITFAVNSKPVVAKMRWTLSPEAYCMRPRRARGDEAILGQVGVPLVFGVNGLYSLDEDLLVCWTDRNWRWTDAELRRDALGRLTAEMEVTLTAVPWVVNMRMRYYKEHMGYSYFNPWARKPKSEPDLFLAAMEELGTRPEETLLIEDGLYSVRTAKAPNCAMRTASS